MAINGSWHSDGGVGRRGLLVGAASALLIGQLPAPSHAERNRIEGLIARMTVAEKAGQLSCFNDEIRPVGAVFNPVVNRQGADALLAKVRAGHVDMLFNGYGVAGARN